MHLVGIGRLGAVVEKENVVSGANHRAKTNMDSEKGAFDFKEDSLQPGCC